MLTNSQGVFRMKLFKSTVLIFGFLLFVCNEAKSQDIRETAEASPNINSIKGKIENLIRQVYIWHEDQNHADYICVTKDSTNSYFVGLDLDDVEYNLDQMRKSNLFSEEFIENYNAIYQEINTKLRSNQLTWIVGTQAPFGNGGDPWCNCQDVPYDEPNPWSQIEVETIDLVDNFGELYWRWGGLEPDTDSDWNDFTYRFRVKRENGKWKIAYLDGFNFDEFTQQKK